jgi:hypothetical protein
MGRRALSCLGALTRPRRGSLTCSLAKRRAQRQRADRALSRLSAGAGEAPVAMDLHVSPAPPNSWLQQARGCAFAPPHAAEPSTLCKRSNAGESSRCTTWEGERRGEGRESGGGCWSPNEQPISQFGSLLSDVTRTSARRAERDQLRLNTAASLPTLSIQLAYTAGFGPPACPQVRVAGREPRSRNRIHLDDLRPRQPPHSIRAFLPVPVACK